MLVGFDISQVAHTGGVATYTNELAMEFSKIEELEMVYFYSSLRKKYTGKLKNVKTFRLPPTLFEVLFNKIRNTNIEKFLGDIDIYHSSDWVQPPSKALKVTTYHDVVPLKYPQWSHPKVVAVHKRRLKVVEKEVDMVIAVSNATKKDLLEITKIPEERIRVVYEGVDKRFKVLSKTEIENFKKRFNLPENFLLAVGGVGDRRNLENIKKATKDYKLIITGIDLPYLTTDEMVLLYNSADALVYASFYEGFGLPILEAMASGTPVVTSNVSSMPEIAGNAAVLVDPESVEEINDGIKKALKEKEKYKKLGIERAKEFSWEKCARETFKVYQELMNEKN